MVPAARHAAAQSDAEGGDGRLHGKKSVPVAFFTYPVMQVANILLPRAHLVPVGEDQLPHIEMTA
jgi:tryptophanyl-tRNA synthetase